MATTKKVEATTDPVVDVDQAEAASGVQVDQPAAALPGDEPPLAGADPREAALASLLAAPQTTVSDIARPVPARPLPRRTGNDFPWFGHGDRYLVLSSAYPRVVESGEVQRARRGDVVTLPDDDRTHVDLANRYIIPA